MAAKFGEFKYGGLTPEQEKMLGRMKKGRQTEMAGATGRMEKMQASRGMGRSGMGMAQLGGLQQAYGAKMAEESGKFRAGAQEKAHERWFGKRAQEFGAESAAEEAKKGRAFETEEAKKRRGHEAAQLERSMKKPKKGAWDYIREGAAVVGDLF